MLVEIEANVARIRAEMPAGVRLLAAVKGRQPHEVLRAIRAGVDLIGENYLQEAEELFRVVGNRVEWHFIGRLQKNKVKKVVQLCDVIETVDSAAIAREISQRAAQVGKMMPVLVQVNIGRESQKSGVLPENVEGVVRGISVLANIKVTGLMVIEPAAARSEDARPFFRETRGLFEWIRSLGLPGVEMVHLSMGMSDTYRVAIEEGANIVRIGTGIFGPRD